MWIRTRLALAYEFPSESILVMKLRPRSGWQQWVAHESTSLEPEAFPVQMTDSFGNLCQRVIVPRGPWRMRHEAVTRIADAVDLNARAPYIPVQDLPEAALPYLAPSRYCESDRFCEATNEAIGDTPPGAAQVRAVVEHIRERIAYVPGASGAPRSAQEIYEDSQAVCSDLAHLAITMCRAISIPARYVSGYLLGLEPPDLHAWFEAYLGGRWYTFDPSEAGTSPGRVVVAYGRDAADAAFITQYGPPVEPSAVDVHVEEAGPPSAH